MRRLRKILLYTLGSLIGIIILAWSFREIYNYIESQKEKSVTYILSDQDKALIQDGDIILRYGHGMVSDYIVNLFEEEYRISHCGIVNKTDKGLEVIHSESSSMLSEEGIQRQDFDEFTDAGHQNSVIIVRYNKSDSLGRTGITKRAQYYLDKKIPFDYGFDFEDTTTMFCSEIIWHIFLDVFHHDIFAKPGEKKPNFKQFENFRDSTQFDIILNHHTRNQ